MVRVDGQTELDGGNVAGAVALDGENVVRAGVAMRRRALPVACRGRWEGVLLGLRLHAAPSPGLITSSCAKRLRRGEDRGVVKVDVCGGGTIMFLVGPGGPIFFRFSGHRRSLEVCPFVKRIGNHTCIILIVVGIHWKQEIFAE